MEGEEEPSSSTFNFDLQTGDLTLPVASSMSVPVLIQNSPVSMPEGGQMLPPPPASDVPSSSKAFTGTAKAPGKVKVKEIVEKNSDEYFRRRQRNNVAVKKSREKTRKKSAYTTQKIEQLKMENEELESKICILTKELSVLKSLFMDHARGLCSGNESNFLNAEQLESLLGCKVIRNHNSETGPSSSSSAGSSCSLGSSQALSTIEPLINAAEIELMVFNGENASTVTQVQTLLDPSTGSFITVDNDDEAETFGPRGS